MTTYRVKPNGKQWVVTDGRGTVSRHRKKSTAKQAARRKAKSGDRVVIHRANGTVQSGSGVR